MATAPTTTDTLANTGNAQIDPNAAASTNGLSTADVGYDIETYVAVKETTTEKNEQTGEVTTDVSYKAYPEEEGKKKVKPGSVDIVFEQSGKFPKALTLVGIIQLTPDEGESKGEAVNLYNRGLKVKLQNRFRSILTSKDDNGEPAFEPQQGAYDLTSEAASPTQKRGLSPLDKVMKILTGASDAQKQAILAALANQ